MLGTRTNPGMKALLLLVGILGAAAGLEFWHASLNPCIGPANHPRLAAVCTHPSGFWPLDFAVLFTAMTIVGFPLLLTRWSLGSRRRDGTGADADSWLRSSFLPWEGSWALFALGTMGVAFLAAYVSEPLGDAWLNQPLSGVAWGVVYLLALGGPPAAVTFAVLLASEVHTGSLFLPLPTSLGAFLGAVVGVLGWGTPFNPPFAVVVASVAYAAFVTGHVLDSGPRASRHALAALAATSTVLLAPPFILAFPRLLFFQATLYVVVLSGVAAAGLWSIRRTERPGFG